MSIFIAHDAARARDADGQSAANGVLLENMYRLCTESRGQGPAAGMAAGYGYKSCCGMGGCGTR